MSNLTTGIESAVLSYLLNSLWQIPVLFAAGWVVSYLLRPISTAAEHRAWVSVLVLQALLPACSLLPHEWSWTQWFSTTTAGPDDAHVSVVMDAGTAWSSLRLPAALLAAVALLYGAVCAYFAARFVWRCWHLHTLRQEAVKVALIGESARYWEQCAERFGIRQVSICTSPHVFGPVTMGIWRKLVLLPASMFASLPDAEMQTVIAHEFAHIRRNDFFKNALYELLSLPLSYHPLFWLTRERIMESREMVCDQMAAEINGRSQYARSLLQLAALLVKGKQARTAHAIGIFDANLFERRLMKLTAKQTEIRGVRRLAIMAACAVFGIATCGSALALGMHVNAQTASDNNGQTITPKNVVVSTPNNVIVIAPKKVVVSAEAMQGNVLTKVQPVYPPDAKKKKVQGTVVLHAEIGKDGLVKDLKVLSGPEALRQSALDAVKQWTYKPYLLNGNPVEVETRINVIYSLGGNGKIPPPPPPPPSE